MVLSATSNVVAWGTYSTCQNYGTYLVLDGVAVKYFADVGGDSKVAIKIPLWSALVTLVLETMSGV